MSVTPAVRPRSALRGALLATVALVSGCLSAGPGACSGEEREFFYSIQHFDGAQVEALDHPYGVCGATFTTDAPAAAVVEHYFAEFEDSGWEASPPDVMPPPHEPGMTSVTLVSAYDGTYQYHVDVSEMDDGSVHVNITAGNAES